MDQATEARARSFAPLLPEAKELYLCTKGIGRPVTFETNPNRLPGQMLGTRRIIRSGNVMIVAGVIEVVMLMATAVHVSGGHHPPLPLVSYECSQCTLNFMRRLIAGNSRRCSG